MKRIKIAGECLGKYLYFTRSLEREVCVLHPLNYKLIYRRRDEPSIIFYNWPIKTGNRRGRQGLNYCKSKAQPTRTLTLQGNN